MKCPKCQYISFDSRERCRNCGYEFSLSVDVPGFDLPIQTGDEALGPLSDFAIERDKAADAAGRSPAHVAAALPVDLPAPAPRPITSSFDLPLFRERKRDDDAPLVAPASSPRPPLAVRRSTPAPRAASAQQPDEPVFDLESTAVFPSEHQAATPANVGASTGKDAEHAVPVASLGSRLLAAVVDGLIMGSIGLAVLYLTLQVCGLEFARVRVIPAVPFGAFLLLVSGGYLTLFTTAGGQTIGKMALGIRVVSIDVARRRVPLAHSLLRAIAYLASALPAGLGLLSAALGADRRAIHDRLADTRVVKA